MDVPLSEDDVVSSLWFAYRKTSEYRSGLVKAILAHHPLVERQEKDGLRAIYTSFIETLNSTKNARFELKNRTIGEWLKEWENMHKLLFRHILKDCGDWRKIEVRFGAPGDEDLYHIPSSRKIPQEISALASMISELISKEYLNNQDKYTVLAKIHYQFIRIHPFADGNGRIARAITDQLSIYFGLPTAMAGYPRHDEGTRKHYHEAIRSCVEDPICSRLALWISGYIEEQLRRLA